MSVSNLFLAAVFAVSIPVHAKAKRSAAPVVKPIVRGGVEYSYAIEKLTTDCPDKEDGCGDRIFVVAKSAKGNVWKSEVYQVVYDAGLERDVQQIFPKALRFKTKTSIELMDEKGKRYTVNRLSGDLVSPKDVFTYSGP